MLVSDSPLESPITQPTRRVIYFDAWSQGPIKGACDLELCRNCGLVRETVLSILKISHKTHRGWCLLRKEGLGLSMSFLIFELWKAVFASLTASRFYDICKCREEAICMKAYYFLYCICSFVRSRWIVSITCARKCCRHRVIRRC